MLIAILLFFPLSLFAQQPYFINYSDKDGLPSNELYDMIQGSAGDLWIGSELGLVRYDGQNFHSYFNEDADNKAINGLFEDADGQIWCLNFANQIFYIEDDSLHLYQPWEKSKIKTNVLIQLSKSHQKKHIIIETTHGLFKLNKHDSLPPKLLIKHFNNYLVTDEHKAVLHSTLFGVHNLQYTKDSFLLEKISCPNCFFWPNIGNHKFPISYLKSTTLKSTTDYYYLILNYKTPYLDKTINSLGEQLLEVENLPLLYKLKNQTQESLETPPNILQYGINLQVVGYQFESTEVLWLATNYGLFRWDLKRGEAIQYFEDISFTDIVIDNEGSFWASTLEQGLYFIPDWLIESIKLQAENSKTTKLSLLDNQLLVGLGNGNVEVYKTELQLKFQKQLTTEKRSPISYLGSNPNTKESWVITGNEAKVFKNGNIITKKGQRNILQFRSTKDMAFDDLGNIIIATGFGMSIYSNSFSQRPNLDSNFSQRPNLDSSWNSNYTSHNIYKFIYLRKCCPRGYSLLWRRNPDYEIWGGFSDDLCIFKAEGTSTVKLPNGKSITAMDIQEDKNGPIWVASANNGLLKIVDEQVVRQISKKDGLPDVYITKILQHQGYLWLATPKGIAKYNPTTDEIIVYDKYYGVPNLKITDMVIWGNRLYFAGAEDLMSLDIRITPTTIAAPIIRLDKLWINDSLLPKYSTDFELEANQNNLRIRLSAITFRSQAAYQFKYRLSPLEKDWVLVGSHSNNIRYPSLPAGDYEFEAFTINKWGAESKSPIQFKFSIALPFYQQWWFISLMVIFGLGVIFGIFWWQLKRLQNRNQNQLERSKLEKDLRVSQLTALKAQMNPHFVFNVLNSIQGLYAIKNTKEANKQLSRFAKMVRLTLHYSNQLTIPLSKELELLSLYLDIEKSRFSEELKIKLNINEELDTEAIKIPSLLIQPYVENAIKHGLLHKKGKKNLRLDVEWEEEGEILMVKVEDDGIGRQASFELNKKRIQHQSFATSANAKRLQLLNQGRQQNTKIGIKYIDKTDDNSQAPTGTIVYIYIPI